MTIFFEIRIGFSHVLPKYKTPIEWLLLQHDLSATAQHTKKNLNLHIMKLLGVVLIHVQRLHNFLLGLQSNLIIVLNYV